MSCPIFFPCYDRHIHSYGDIFVCVLCSDLLHHWLHYIYDRERLSAENADLLGAYHEIIRFESKFMFI